MYSCDVSRFLEGCDRERVVAVLLVQESQGAQRLDERGRSGTAFCLQFGDLPAQLLGGTRRCELGLRAQADRYRDGGRGGSEEPIDGRAHRGRKRLAAPGVRRKLRPLVRPCTVKIRPRGRRPSCTRRFLSDAFSPTPCVRFAKPWTIFPDTLPCPARKLEATSPCGCPCRDRHQRGERAAHGIHVAALGWDTRRNTPLRVAECIQLVGAQPHRINWNMRAAPECILQLSVLSSRSRGAT